MKKGRFVNIGKNCHFKGDISIGDYCRFNRNVIIDASKLGKVIIGNYVIIAPNVVIRNSNHGYSDLNKPILKQPKKVKDIVIEDDVWIASNCVITAGVTIGQGSVIGAGCVISEDIPPYSVVVVQRPMILKNRRGSK